MLSDSEVQLEAALLECAVALVVCVLERVLLDEDDTAADGAAPLP